MHETPTPQTTAPLTTTPLTTAPLRTLLESFPEAPLDSFPADHCFVEPCDPVGQHSTYLFQYQSPYGEIVVGTTAEAVTACAFDRSNLRLSGSALALTAAPASTQIFAQRVKNALSEYFEGNLDSLSQIPVLQAGTVFQQLIWNALRRVKGGTVISYSQLAAAVDRPAAVRAAGTACGRNQILLFVPCHRIVRRGAGVIEIRLGGFAAGVECKRALLRHEGIL